ncbi:MAG: hypothetical protein IPK80_03020 [Nannocystis sp.]|nr:hypothetical protein [Nannocystis sp.]
MWTHAISGNPNVIGNKGFHGIGTGNKAMLGTDAPALLGLPLAQLTALSARYALRTAWQHPHPQSSVHQHSHRRQRRRHSYVDLFSD